jgi:hypothetical protein
MKNILFEHKISLIIAKWADNKSLEISNPPVESIFTASFIWNKKCEKLLHGIVACSVIPLEEGCTLILVSL